MSELYEADALSEVLAHLLSDPSVVEAFGGADHITGLPEGPFPHLVVSPGPGGDLGEALSSITPDVQLESLGGPDGETGSHELWQLLMRAVVSVKGMPERDHVSGRPVVTFVRFIGGVAKQNLSSGQTRWQATASVSITPPQ